MATKDRLRWAGLGTFRSVGLTANDRRYPTFARRLRDSNLMGSLGIMATVQSAASRRIFTTLQIRNIDAFKGNACGDHFGYGQPLYLVDAIDCYRVGIRYSGAEVSWASAVGRNHSH